LPEIHGFVTSQYWQADRYIQNAYANADNLDDAAHYSPGESCFDPHSAYIDIISEITQHFLAEVEFELYHGSGYDSVGNVKAGAIRGVWHKYPFLNVSIGRQMVLLGSQEKIYYPSSKYRLFTWQDPLTEKFLRFTGWWDTGLAILGVIPISDTGMYIEYGAMISNGPGSNEKKKTDSGSMLGLDTTKGVMNKDGYVYEMFMNRLRQRLDNNNDKPISWRLGFSPIKGLLLRGEGMAGKYDTNDKYGFNFLTAELFYTLGGLDVVGQYGQLKFEAPKDTAANYIWPGGEVKQMAYAVGIDYKVINKKLGINYLQPVARFSYINPNVEPPEELKQYKSYGERYIYDVGINFSPWEHVIFKAAYRWQNEITGPEIPNNGFTLEALYDF